MYPEQIFLSIVLLFFLCLLFVIIKEKWELLMTIEEAIGMDP